MTQTTTCTKCVNGVRKNINFPCDCGLGDTAVFTVAGYSHPITGIELRDWMHKGVADFAAFMVLPLSSLVMFSIDGLTGLPTNILFFVMLVTGVSVCLMVRKYVYRMLSRPKKAMA